MSATINDILGDVEMHVIQQNVEIFKGLCWKGAMGIVINKYGIKDESIPDMVDEQFALATKEIPAEMHATIQDSLSEFRSEYKKMTS